MKINKNNLKTLYTAYLKDKASGSRKNCPSPRELLNGLRAESSLKKRNQIVKHLAQCHSCAQEFEFILQALRYEKEINQKLDQLLASLPEKTKSKNPFFPFFRKYSWKYLSLIGTVVLFGGLTVVFFFLPNLSENQYRGKAEPRIKLTHPVNKSISPPITFEWKKTEKADYYILEIFDETLYPIWKSPKIKETKLELPSEVVKTLEENKPYYWMITSYLFHGEKAESTVEEFSVQK